MAAALADRVKEAYHLTLSPDYAERCLASLPTLTAAELYRKALSENIKDIHDSSVLPFGIASQTSATLPSNVVLQVHTSRDATQPLRPCADATEEEAALHAALQRTNSRRLLRLVLTDGYVEIPAFELSTLSVFNGVPIPGEKLLLRAGTEVKSGAVIMTEKDVVPLGGEVTPLKMEFLAHRRRVEAGYQVSGGLQGAPKFRPIDALTTRAAFGDCGLPRSDPPPQQQRRDRGGGGRPSGGGSYRGRGRGRGGDQGRGGSRGGGGYGFHHDPKGNGANSDGGGRRRGWGGEERDRKSVV